MNKAQYDIHRRSLDAAFEHLRMLDLDDMAATALVHGTYEDGVKIRLATLILSHLPIDRPEPGASG